jgi:hypothetical protein
MNLIVYTSLIHNLEMNSSKPKEIQITFDDINECIQHYNLNCKNDKWIEFSGINNILLYKVIPLSEKKAKFIFRIPNSSARDREAIISLS